MKPGKFNILVDSAWGSSGKGAASTRLADIHRVKHLSGNNYANAGHTVIVGEDKYVFKVIPSGAALIKSKSRDDIKLWIGPGSGFFLGQLVKELKETNAQNSIIVHERAIQMAARHIEMESPTGVQSTEHISSTMSGSGAAFTEKAMRKKEVETMTLSGMGTNNWMFFDLIQDHLSRSDTFLHEVSQGFALSVDWGTHYPFCTFRNCTPQQAIADMMVLPDQVGDVYLNVRSLPIRVGNNYDKEGKQVGYSGDTMHDSRELTWEEVAKDSEMPEGEAQALAERERTTVTKKIRRVFTPSWTLLQQSARMCGATKLVLNFPQYIHWSAHKVRGGRSALLELHYSVREYIDKMQEVTNLPVALIGTGAEHADFICMD